MEMPGCELFPGDALGAYGRWPAPAVMFSDGAYGVGGFRGDPGGPEGLEEWYRPHVERRSAAATPATTLWLGNTEIGWASLHPLLGRHGWDYVQLIIWDKGIAHIAGNVNGQTIRRFPIVTEVCAPYQRRIELPGRTGPVAARDWLRGEWQRAGLPLRAAGRACGVKDAATRKYLTRDRHWYWPPGLMVQRLAGYANAGGDPAGRPYFR
jgi:site-specific DNA-methyltransferase (adenine-specific)